MKIKFRDAFGQGWHLYDHLEKVHWMPNALHPWRALGEAARVESEGASSEDFRMADVMNLNPAPPSSDQEARGVVHVIARHSDGHEVSFAIGDDCYLLGDDGRTIEKIH